MNKTNQLPWRWIAGIGMASKVLLPLTAFVWVAIYSHLIDPGHEATYYQAYLKKASSYVSIVTGIPIFFYFAWWLGRRSSRREVASTVLIWVIYVALDLPLLLFFDFSEIWVQTIMAHLTKLLAAYGGAKLVQQQFKITRNAVN